MITDRIEPHGDTHGRVFTPARQVHKGERGQKPPIEKPKFVREQKNAKNRRFAWAKLLDIVLLTGCSEERLLDAYAPFADCGSGNRCDFLVGMSHSDVHGKTPDVTKTHGDWRAVPAFAQTLPRNVWIRQGFANVILYLVHFGYTPERARHDRAALLRRVARTAEEHEMRYEA